MTDDRIREGLTFDDVLLVPGGSEVLPRDVELRTQLTAEISLEIPLISAAMDTVTEHETAICMAQNGGIGIVHRNMAVERQAAEIDKVKRSESGMIVDPITMSPERPIHEALEVMRRYRISGVPITREGKAVGILTNRDLRFVKDITAPISAVMTTEGLVTVPPGTTMELAKELLHRHRIEKLLVVDEAGMLRGLITIKDIEKSERFPHASKDALGRLRCGAAVGAGDDSLDRARALVGAGVDVIVVDSAHGHSQGVLDTVQRLRREFAELPVIGGNVATGEGTEALIKAGVSAVKVGVGPGSICTTRVVAGVGVPQFTAVLDAAQVAARFGIPVIADGGVKYSGDLVKALAAGSSSVMIGSLFAGTDEAPQAGARGHRGSCSLPGEPLEQRLPAARRSALGDGLLRRDQPAGPARQGSLRAHLGGGSPGESRPRRDRHERSPQLSHRVIDASRLLKNPGPSQVRQCGPRSRRGTTAVVDLQQGSATRSSGRRGVPGDGRGSSAAC
jgi:IMP dehydrogenase